MKKAGVIIVLCFTVCLSARQVFSQEREKERAPLGGLTLTNQYVPLDMLPGDVKPAGEEKAPAKSKEKDQNTPATPDDKKDEKYGKGDKAEKDKEPAKSEDKSQKTPGTPKEDKDEKNKKDNKDINDKNGKKNGNPEQLKVKKIVFRLHKLTPGREIDVFIKKSRRAYVQVRKFNTASTPDETPSYTVRRYKTKLSKDKIKQLEALLKKHKVLSLTVNKRDTKHSKGVTVIKSLAVELTSGKKKNLSFGLGYEFHAGLETISKWFVEKADNIASGTKPFYVKTTPWIDNRKQQVPGLNWAPKGF